MLKQINKQKAPHEIRLDVDLGEAVHTIARGLDYVGVDDINHGRRVGLMCFRVAEALRWPKERAYFALKAGMLHDCGVSSTSVHKKLSKNLEWSGAEEHCERGAFFLECFNPLAKFSDAVRYHHTRFEDLPDELDEATKELTNLIFLIDRLDVYYARFCLEHDSCEILYGHQEIVEKLSNHAGRLFAPILVEGLKEAVRKDAFWLEIEDDLIGRTIEDVLTYEDFSTVLDFDDLLALGEFFSQIIDAKSPYTHYHSLRVADLSYAMGGLMGMPQMQRQYIRLAALLHDIGKLRTPDAILEKDGPLTRKEEAMMKRHPLDSRSVLEHLFPKSDIPFWAACHHEKLDGTGYPMGLRAEQIPLEARVIAVCDIFQALSQERPYRGRLTADEVLGIMEIMVPHKLDGTVFGYLKANIREMYAISTR